ncbi:MAG: YbeD family protein [Halochromatium sp.]|uniref:YbeD family protein n=1 Tax=Halochromatium sp. TaxID=2049430 RepID=UPI00397DCDA5
MADSSPAQQPPDTPPDDLQDETLLRFPCDFPIKAMGRAEDGIETILAAIVERHAPGTSKERMRSRASRNGRWVSVTVVIEARSKGQLDAIYRELSVHERITCAF